MKKWMCLLAVLVTTASSFGIVTEVVIGDLQVGGALTEYNPVTGKLEWKAGASATLNTTEGDSIPASVTVIANFQLVADGSADGWAKGTFNVLDWQFNFVGTGGEFGHIEGNAVGGTTYVEVEGTENTLPFGDPWINAGHLYGAAIVNVTESDFSQFGGAHWEDVDGGLARLKSETLVAPTFDSYSQSYSTNLSALFLYADETVIPEPATMALLGLGALLLRRRRA